MTVKRYDPHWHDREMEQDSTGDYVLFEDYAKLQERIEKLEAALRAIVNEYESPHGCVIDGAMMGRIAKEVLDEK